MNDTQLSKSVKALTSFIFDNGIAVTKTKKATGFMIYNPSQVTDLKRLTSLAEALPTWKVIVSDDEWDKGTKVRSSAIFVGPVTSDLDVTSDKALLDYIKSIVQDTSVRWGVLRALSLNRIAHYQPLGYFVSEWSSIFIYIM